MSCAETRALAAMAERLADIRKSTTYRTELGLRLCDEPPEPEEAPKSPFLVQGGINAAAQVSEPHDYSMTLDLDVYIEINSGCTYPQARTLGWDALRDIERALRANPDWSDTVLEMRVIAKTMPPRVRGSNYITATATVEIDYLDED